jgi:NodT family efflux transporter outer membrane factor (OMF) lipoprotein
LAKLLSSAGRPRTATAASDRCAIRSQRRPPKGLLVAAIIGVLASGCTPLGEYVRNGFEVGPDYGRPPAPVAEHWIDAADKRVRTDEDDLSQWWTVFNDPALSDLVAGAYRQNISLRQAGFQVLAARAQLGIAIGEIFPQTQQNTGSYVREGLSLATANGPGGTSVAAAAATGTGASARTFKRFFGQWNYGFNLAWELDFWGRYRRAIESADANLDASVEGYDEVLVTLLADVATNYVNIRTLQERIKLVRANVQLQQQTLQIASALFRGGRGTELDVDQAQSTLSQTAAEIPQLETQLRQANNQLCILLGIPPQDLTQRIGSADIPRAPDDVAVGIPADLIRRRPDVRRAERQAAAQSAQIGIADADFYPRIALSGTFGWTAEHLNHLFTPQAFEGTFGPQFTWNLLNYGRILNNVRLQTAQFQALVAGYQNAVLTAGAEVENGLISFLKAQEQVTDLTQSVESAQKAVNIALVQYRNGAIDFNRLAVIEQNLVQQQDLLAQARGAIDLGLIQVYRSLAGGWQIRCPDAKPGPRKLTRRDAPPVVGAGSAPAAVPVSPPPPVANPLPPPTPVSPAAAWRVEETPKPGRPPQVKIGKLEIQ